VAIIDESMEVVRTVTLKYDDDDRVCVTSICVDDDKRIYITDPCAMDMVQIFEPDGKLSKVFGVHKAGRQNFSFPRGITVLDNGEIWVVDTIRHLVTRFSSSGELLGFVGGKGEGPGALEYPSGITTDGTGRIFVVERVGNRYQCFSFELVEGIKGVNVTNKSLKGGE
jgi:sugar lactone lactonase YvrE